MAVKSILSQTRRRRPDCPRVVHPIVLFRASVACSVLWSAPALALPSAIPEQGGTPPAATELSSLGVSGRLPVYPQIRVNGRLSEALAAFFVQDNALYTSAATLRQLGIDVPAEALRAVAWVAEATADSAQSERLFELASLSALRSEYDAARQTLALTAPLAWLHLPTARLGAEAREEYIVAQPGFAAVLNYDASVGEDGRGGQRLGAFTEWRGATPWGYLSHSWLLSRERASSGVTTTRSARLDTYWRSTWPQRGLALTVGDTFTVQHGGAGGTRIGGAKLEKSFALQPWRTTTPLASYLGSSTLPSTVDLYINGTRYFSEQVPAGPYSLTLPPVISGAGMAQVVTTDALGRTTVIDMPLYGGSGMLARGLGEWSVESGFIRKGYGSGGTGYDDRPVFSASARYGLTDRLTGQVHAEAVRDYRQAGVAFNWVVGTLGQLNASYAGSRFRGQYGARRSLTFNTQLAGLTLGLGHSQSDEKYASMAATVGADPFRPLGQRHRMSSAALGWNSSALGSWHLSYVRSQHGSTAAEENVSLGWSKTLNRHASLYLGATRGLGGERQHAVFAGLSIQLDNRMSASAGVSRGTNGMRYQLDVRRPASELGSLGWNVGGQHQGSRSGSSAFTSAWAGLQYNSAYGDGWLNLRSTSSRTNWDASWRGGLVWMQGDLFAAKTVTDSFAVVSTSGVPDIPVLVHNSRAAVTNRGGRALVSNLAAFQKNTVAISTLDLPANMRIERTRAEVVPAERSGMAVEFKVEQVRSVLLTLADAQGMHPPAGSPIRDSLGEAVAVVGFDGQVYFEDMPAGTAHYQVDWLDQNRRCHFSIAYPVQEKAETILNLGVVPCGN